MIAELKTVASLIDATAFDSGGRVGIRYVKENGEIREMIVSKAKLAGHNRPPSKSTVKQRFISTNVKEKALIKVLDHTEGARYKSLFMFAIIAFNPDGQLGPWHTIKRG